MSEVTQQTLKKEQAGTLELRAAGTREELHGRRSG